MTIFLYGPSGSGKSTIGRLLAQQLGMTFVDLDGEIERRAGKSVSDLFAQDGEAGFRQREQGVLAQVLESKAGVVALGGGTLLDEHNRRLADSRGAVLCLNATPETLLARLRGDATPRPLLAGDAAGRLRALLTARQAHYQSFPLSLDTTHLGAEEAAWEAQVRLGIFRIAGMGNGTMVRIRSGGLAEIGDALTAEGLKPPLVVVSDAHVKPHHAPALLRQLYASGYTAELVTIPAGEAHKSLDTAAGLWQAFLMHKLERGGTVVALGGGVVGDLAGFAAAVYLRGVSWVNLPTSLLAMVDASLGGKTGANLPQGKNLIGAFHAPRLVLSDARTLVTLPQPEFRNGLAEVVKHGVIADEALFDLCAGGLEGLAGDWDALVRRAAAVKIKIIEQDPFEGGLRQVLNLGHTLGHALEKVLDYRIRHGEAVALGMVAEARLAEAIGLAQRGVAGQIAACLAGLGLPTVLPDGIDADELAAAMAVDKKKADGVVRFALPLRIGKVRHGVVVADAMKILRSL